MLGGARNNMHKGQMSMEGQNTFSITLLWFYRTSHSRCYKAREQRAGTESISWYFMRKGLGDIWIFSLFFHQEPSSFNSHLSADVFACPGTIRWASNKREIFPFCRQVWYEEQRFPSPISLTFLAQGIARRVWHLSFHFCYKLHKASTFQKKERRL